MNIINVTNHLQPKESLIPLKIDKIKFLVIHHTDSGNNYTWEQCNQDHKNNGWSCAGYNEMIYPNGDVYILRDLNVGAQCAGFNSCSYGISLIGDFELNGNVPSEQYNALVERIKYNLGRFPNNCVVVPHRVLVGTDCPGDAFPFAKLLQDVAKTDDVNPSYKNCVDIVAAKCGLNSKEYWYKHKDPYVQILIQKMANYIYSNTNV